MEANTEGKVKRKERCTRCGKEGCGGLIEVNGFHIGPCASVSALDAGRLIKALEGKAS
jgi:hypothetical protein